MDNSHLKNFSLYLSSYCSAWLIVSLYQLHLTERSFISGRDRAFSLFDFAMLGSQTTWCGICGTQHLCGKRIIASPCKTIFIRITGSPNLHSAQKDTPSDLLQSQIYRIAIETPSIYCFSLFGAHSSARNCTHRIIRSTKESGQLFFDFHRQKDTEV